MVLWAAGGVLLGRGQKDKDVIACQIGLSSGEGLDVGSDPFGTGTDAFGAIFVVEDLVRIVAAHIFLNPFKNAIAIARSLTVIVLNPVANARSPSSIPFNGREEDRILS